MAETNYMDFGGENLPFSLEAEQSVLGAILIDPKSILQVADSLKPIHFHVPQHQSIFETLLNMFELNEIIDPVTVLEWLKKNKVYDESGGKAYLTQLAQMVPSSTNINGFSPAKVSITLLPLSVFILSKISFDLCSNILSKYQLEKPACPPFNISIKVSLSKYK